MHASWRPTHLRGSALERLSKRSWRSHCWEVVQFVEFITILCTSKNCRHGQWRKSRARERSFMRHRNSFLYAHGRLPPEELGNGAVVPKIQRTCCSPRRHCERRFWVLHCFLEQGSSASQMTATRVMHVVARLPRCAGQAADAVSAYTQVNMEDARALLLPKSECPEIWIRPPRHKWPKSWFNIEELVVPFDRNENGHPLARLLWEGQVEKVLVELDGERYRIGHAYLSIKSKVYRKMWMTSTWLERRKSRSHVEEFDETRWTGRICIVSWPRVLGMHSTRM